MNPTIVYHLFHATDTHYQAVISIHNQLYPDAPTNIEETRYWDTVLKTSGRHPYRILAYSEQRPVGSGWAYIESTPDHVIRFQIKISVLPDFAERGVIEDLYSQLNHLIAPHQPTQLATITHENTPDIIHFLNSQGFELAITSWKQVLDIDAVKIGNYNTLFNNLTREGIKIETHASLVYAPNRDRKLYDLMIAVERDIPVVDMAEPLTYEAWRQDNSPESPYFLSDGLFVAVHGSDYVGVCQLFKPAKPKSLHNGITGVRKEYRRRGIALALKVSTIRFAQQHKITTITTYNASNNQPVLQMNKKLGFRKLPAELTYLKTL